MTKQEEAYLVLENMIQSVAIDDDSGWRTCEGFKLYIKQALARCDESQLDDLIKNPHGVNKTLGTVTMTFDMFQAIDVIAEHCRKHQPDIFGNDRVIIKGISNEVTCYPATFEGIQEVKKMICRTKGKEDDGNTQP